MKEVGKSKRDNGKIKIESLRKTPTNMGGEKPCSSMKNGFDGLISRIDMI